MSIEHIPDGHTWDRPHDNEPAPMTSDKSPTSPAQRIHELEKALRYSVRFLKPAEHDVDYVLGVLQGGGTEAPGEGQPTAGLDLEAAVKNILVTVREAASGYHNSQRWSDSEYGQPSYWEKIEQAESVALMVAARLRSIPAPAPLVWTKEKPKVEGWYFLRVPASGMLSGEPGATDVEFIKTGERDFVYVNREWAGLIPQPSPTKGVTP